MIELFASDTPNGKKISIMLEEINLPFNVIPVDLNKGEQFEKKFPVGTIIESEVVYMCVWIWSNIDLLSREEQKIL